MTYSRKTVFSKASKPCTKFVHFHWYVYVRSILTKCQSFNLIGLVAESTEREEEFVSEEGEQYVHAVRRERYNSC